MPSEDPWKYFIVKADRFLRKTSEHVLQGINPGGYYHAIWCRDASYILRDWFLSGNTQGVLQQIYLIWSHQIHKDQNEKIVYGRGSPERNYSMSPVEGKLRERFFGALPTTIYQAGYCEIYGENPDIDSTALMISTTSWILANLVHAHKSERHFQLPLVPIIGSQGEGNETNADPNASKSNPSRSTPSHKRVKKSNYKALAKNNPAADFSHLLDFTIARMLKAVDYLSSRDIDNDGLLEQNHNEDWMDTVLRAGKIVYSQASWILALSNLASLLEKLKGYEKDLIKISKLARRTIQGVEQNLWSEEDGAYIDIQETHHIGGPYRTLTQDVSLYLVAITENTSRDVLRTSIRGSKRQKEEEDLNIDSQSSTLHKRAISTLDAIRKRAWKQKWPLDTEVLLHATGPWVLKPYQYHNHTFWPWTTGIEMLARSRLDQTKECSILLDTLSSEGHPHIHAFYEWVNPLTDKGDGAYPFRTGISCIRIALANISNNVKSKSKTT